MSWERDDEWLWDIYILCIDMLAKLLEGNLLKLIISVNRFGSKMTFCNEGIWDLKVS